MITRKDVAKYAGVSAATVSRVASGRGYVSDEARKKVQEAISRLNYIPNNIAKNFSQNKSNVVAVLVEDVTNPYYLQILESMEEEGVKHNLIISLFVVNKHNVDIIVQGLIQNRVCAIINLALFACSEKYVAILDELNIYTVNIRKGNVGGVHISLNHDKAFDEICAYLKSKGRNKLVYFAALNEDLAHQDIRLRAYLKCVEKYGFVKDERYTVFGDYPREKAFSVGYKSAEQLCDSEVEFDSVLCMNDSVAMGAMKLFLERGYAVPEDVCIIGCDNIIVGEYITPSLSTIDVETKKQGVAYVRAVVEQGNFTMEEINARFIPRNSSV